jgi:hypothetical protein
MNNENDMVEEKLRAVWDKLREVTKRAQDSKMHLF